MDLLVWCGHKVGGLSVSNAEAVQAQIFDVISIFHDVFSVCNPPLTYILKDV